MDLRILRRPAIAAGLAFACALRVEAQGQTDRVPPMSLRETAVSLARSGAANNDARTVLAAAQLMITAERTSPGLERVEPATMDSVRREERQKAEAFTAAGLLRLASRIAVEQRDAPIAKAAAELAANAEVGLGEAALATELRTAANALASTRGSLGGPIWTDGFLASGQVMEYKVTFEGAHAPNKIDVSTNSSSADLDCYLYENRQLVARDDGYGGSCSIKWSQKYTGAMTLRIRNTGVASYYVLISN